MPVISSLSSSFDSFFWLFSSRNALGCLERVGLGVGGGFGAEVPWLSLAERGDLKMLFVEKAVMCVKDASVESLSKEGLRFEQNTTHFAGVEVAGFLEGLEESFIVEVSVSKVPTECESGHDLTIHPFVFSDGMVDRVGKESAKCAAVKVHETKGHDLAHEGDGCRFVIERGELVIDPGGAKGEVFVEFVVTLFVKEPDTHGPVASVIAHGR